MENLYLSCSECNRKKLPNSTIPVNECLNPCDHSENPADHLTFDDENIRAKSGSQKGTQTIRKYGLDRRDLDYLRLKQLQSFDKLLRKLRERQLRDGGRSLTDREKEIVASFKQPDHAFSLMFRVYLDEVDL